MAESITQQIDEDFEAQYMQDNLDSYVMTEADENMMQNNMANVTENEVELLKDNIRIFTS